MQQLARIPTPNLKFKLVALWVFLIFPCSLAETPTTMKPVQIRNQVNFKNLRPHCIHNRRIFSEKSAAFCCNINPHQSTIHNLFSIRSAPIAHKIKLWRETQNLKGNNILLENNHHHPYNHPHEYCPHILFQWYLPSSSSSSNFSHDESKLSKYKLNSYTYSNGETSSKSALEFIRKCGKLKTTIRSGWIRRNFSTHLNNKNIKLESVADHTWRVSLMCLLLLAQQTDDTYHHPHDENKNKNDSRNINFQINNKTINVEKCIQMAVVHDLAECIVGDICPADNIPKEKKHQWEKDAIHQLAQLLNDATTNTNDKNDNGNSTTTTENQASQYLLDLWNEYETRKTEEAKAVKDLDLLDMIVQADEYEQMIGQTCDELQEFFDGTMPHRFHNVVLKEIANELHLQRNERLSKVDDDYNWDNLEDSNQDVGGQNSSQDKQTKILGKSDRILPVEKSLRDETIRDIHQKQSTEDEFIKHYAKINHMSTNTVRDVIEAYSKWNDQ